MKKNEKHVNTAKIDINSQISIGKAMKKVGLKKFHIVEICVDDKNCIIIKKFKT